MQTYVQRPVPVLVENEFSTGKSSRIARLIVGDILAHQYQVGQDEPVRINQQYGAARAGCSVHTFNQALSRLQKGAFVVQTENHRKGHNAKGYNVPAEILSEGFSWKSFHVHQANPLHTPGHIQTEDTEAQRIHFRNIRADHYLPAIEFLQRKERAQLLEVTDWRQFYKCRNAQQLAEILTDISALKIIDPKGKNAQALLLELSFRFYQLHQLATGGADTFIFLHEQTQRIYSTFTQIPREFRKGLRYHYTGGNYTRNLKPAEIAPYNGCGFAEVDVRNSQPLLLSVFIKKNGIHAPRLLNDTQGGTFHISMMDALGIPHDQKNTGYKPRLFHYLYGRANDPTRDEFKAAFSDLYGGEAAAWIEQHKREKGYRSLPINLQQLESAAMIYRAARRVRHLHPSAPVLTVHDSLLIPDRPDILEASSLAIKRAFSDLYGIDARTSYEDSQKHTHEG
jgi:hypothetical protein